MATLTMYEVNGTKLNAVGYTAKGKELSIEFKSGKVYTFYDVPKTVFTAMQEADNADTYFMKNVKGKFDYAMEEAEVQEETPAPKAKTAKPAANSKKPVAKTRKPAAKAKTSTAKAKTPRASADKESGVKGIIWSARTNKWIVRAMVDVVGRARKTRKWVGFADTVKEGKSMQAEFIKTYKPVKMAAKKAA